MNNSGGTTQISWRWFELQHIFLAFFCIAWDSFLIFWYSMALHGGPLIMIIFPIAHVAVGVGLTYYTLAGFLNRTTVQIGRRELVIRHGPMPWFSNRNINANDLREVNVNNTSTTNGPFNRQNVPAYRVDAVTSSGRTIPLLMLKSEDQARFVKQQIQERFAIKL